MIRTTFSAAARSLLLVGGLALGTMALAQAQTCLDYRVNLRGVVSGTHGTMQFTGVQRATVRLPGVAANPVELVLSTGRDLNASDGSAISI